MTTKHLRCNCAATPVSRFLQGRVISWQGMRVAIVSVLTALHLGTFAQAEGQPPFRNDAAPGPYVAGFRVVAQYDYSRTFQPEIDELGRPYAGERARPIQTLMWYPAERSADKAMTWGDYVALDATQVSFNQPRAIPTAADYFKSLIAPSGTERMRAIRDAHEAPGRHPVVIYAPSFSSGAWENSEFLRISRELGLCRHRESRYGSELFLYARSCWSRGAGSGYQLPSRLCPVTVQH